MRNYMLFLLFIISCSTQEFNDLVCNGFVDLPNDYDYATLEIHLYTEADQQLVEKSLCANNGFYLLPIYDLKDYYLEVVSQDQILLFTPEKVHLKFSTLDFAQARSFCDSMINFKLAGFKLKDQIQLFNQQPNYHPLLPQYDIELYQEDQLLTTTQTTSDGHYTFNNIQTGTYIIKAKNQMYFKNNSIKCVIQWPNGKQCDGNLVIYGFDVQGQLHNDNQPLSHFTVQLVQHANNKIDSILNCESNSDYLCQTNSNEKGEFKFQAIPIGKYYLRFSPNSQQIEIEPNEIELELMDNDYYLNQQLNINKLTIGGRIIDSKQKGIGNVKIYLDGLLQTQTQEDGTYTLDKIKTGTYTLEGHHENYVFEPLTNLKLSLGLHEIPNLSLKYLNLCGQIDLNLDESFQEKSDYQNMMIVIYLENQEEKSEKRSTRVSKEDDFKYCFQARPGNYLVYPVVMEGKGKEIMWQPKQRLIELQDHPQLNVNFERKIVILGGQVQFLSNNESQQLKNTVVRLYAVKEPHKLLQEQSLYNFVGSQASFQFANILHGSYQVLIHNPALCFQQVQIPLIITPTSTSDLLFIQTGFSINYQINQNVPIELTPGNEKYVLSPTSNQLCVQKWNTYQIKVDDCLKAKPQVQQYVMPTGFFQVEIQRVRVQGIIKYSQKIDSNIIKIEIVSTSRQNQVERDLIDVSEKNENELEFTWYAKQNSVIILKPKIMENLSEENLLFQPYSRQFNVGEDCLKQAEVFELNTGLLIMVEFEQEIDDVLIAINDDDEEIETLYTSQQENKLGPFLSNLNYTVTVQKEGYRFTQKEQFKDKIMLVKVQVERLGTIKIEIVDKWQKPLPQVMIFISTISKINHFRINNQTNDDGLFVSTNFAQGEYLVKAFLKEYMFEPSSKTINLVSGQHENVKIVGTKIAFSIFGQIYDFNKDGIEGMQVEAYTLPLQGDNQLAKEISVTDKSGSYRIRGLEPFKRYMVKVKSEIQVQTILSPQSFEVLMNQEDIHNQNFIMFQKPKVYLIQGDLLIDEGFTEEENKLYSISEFTVQPKNEQAQNFRKLQFHRYFEVEMSEVIELSIKIVVEKEKERGEQVRWSKEFSFDVSKQDFNIKNRIYV